MNETSLTIFPNFEMSSMPAWTDSVFLPISSKKVDEKSASPVADSYKSCKGGHRRELNVDANAGPRAEPGPAELESGLQAYVCSHARVVPRGPGGDAGGREARGGEGKMVERVRALRPQTVDWAAHGGP